MVNKRKKVGVVVVVAICVIPAMIGLAWTSGIFTTKTNAPQTSAERMILKPSDLGSDWQGQELGSDASYLGAGSQTYWTLERCSNQSPLLLNIAISVFNSSLLCEGAFLNLSSQFTNCTNITLGDQGISYNWTTVHGELPCVTFTIRNVLCEIDTISSHYPQNWWRGTLYYIATYQLEKIEQTLVT